MRTDVNECDKQVYPRKPTTHKERVLGMEKGLRG